MMNVLAIIVVTVLGMVIGWIWYGPAFGKQWMKMVGIKKKDTEKINPWLMLFAVLVNAVMFTVFSYFIDVFAVSKISQGIALGAVFWLGFLAPKDMSPVLWEKKPMRLFLINSSYSLVMMVVAGVILAIW